MELSSFMGYSINDKGGGIKKYVFLGHISGAYFLLGLIYLNITRVSKIRRGLVYGPVSNPEAEPPTARAS